MRYDPALPAAVAEAEARITVVVLSEVQVCCPAPVSPARGVALAGTPRQLRDYIAERTFYFGLAALFNVKHIFPGRVSWNIPVSGHVAFEV